LIYDALMRITIAICLVGLTVGCSKKDDKTSPATDKIAEPAKPDKPSVKPVLEMFTGSKVTLPPMFADAKLGGPIDSAAKGIPGFKPDSKIKLDGWDGKVEVMVDTTADKKSIRVMQLFVPTPIDKLKAELDKKWGASRAAGNSFYWADPDAQIRVKATDNVGGSELDFEPVQSIAQLMGSGTQFGFEAKAPLLGMAEADAKALPGATVQSDGRIAFTLPALDSSEYGGTATAKVEGGKVVEVYVQISFTLDPAAKDAAIAALKTKFGLKPRDEMYLESKGPPAVTVDVSSKDQLAIWVKSKK
jgi:hypothetical protein